MCGYIILVAHRVNVSNPLREITNFMSNSKSWKTKLTLLLASSLTIMAATTIAPSLPAMNQHFESTVADPDLRATLVQLVITLPALFIVIGSPIAGIVVDRFGRKPLLLISTLLYGLAGSSGIYLESLTTILLGRAMLGWAVAGIMMSATTLIADYYSGSTRTAFMGLQSGFMGLGGVLFLTLGGILAQQSWHYPFGIYLFAWLIVPLIALFIFEPHQAEPISERLSSHPYVAAETEIVVQSTPIGVMVVVYGLTMLSQIAFYLIPVQMPFFLKDLVQAVPSQTGMAIAFCTLFAAIASVNYGKIKKRIEFVIFLPLVFGLMGIGYLLVGQSSNWAQVLTGLALCGMGVGLLMPNMSIWLMTTVPEAIRGRALGGLSTAMFFGQFLSPIVTQPFTETLGLGNVYAIAGGMLLVMALGSAIFKTQLLTLTRVRVFKTRG
jgi:MFS family permease